ncbi:MAG: glycosyltransferase family 2 protein [Rhodospirillales bacterium]
MIHLPQGDRTLVSGPRNQSPLERPLLSVVVPMLDEADNLKPLFDRLFPVLDRIGMETEVICVDDGSRDQTLDRLKAMRARNPRLKIISFSRNFGKEVALAAGLRYARGDAVILMDGDLQHPPETIEAFVNCWRQGYQMVYGQRRHTGRAGIRHFFARGFYRAFAVLAQTPLSEGACDFRLIDRRAVDSLNRLTERSRFTKGLYSWIGFKQIGVPFDVERRQNGRSGWSHLGLWRFALDAITSFSMIPLRIWSYVGGIVSLFALSYGLYCSLREAIYGTDVPEFSSLMIAVTFFAGIQLLSLGVIGEYLGRVFTEVKQRPLFLVAEEVGFADSAEEFEESDVVLQSCTAAGVLLVHPGNDTNRVPVSGRNEAGRTARGSK